MIAELMMLVSKCFLFARQKVAIYSKFQLLLRLRTSEITGQILLATQHSKNKWFTDSGSLQNKQVLSESSLLFARLSLVRIFFFVSNHRKICTLGGILTFQTEETYKGMTPL